MSKHDNEEKNDDDQHEEEFQDQRPVALDHVKELQQLVMRRFYVRLPSEQQIVNIVSKRTPDATICTTTYAMSMSSSMREMISPCSATMVAIRVYMPVI